MSVSRYFPLTVFAALLRLVSSGGVYDDVYDPVSDPIYDSDSVCYSYGVDFLDEGNYFINSQSTESFSAVSIFKGCNTDVADILLIDPNDVEYLCDEVPTTPDETNQLSECPIRKNQMSSGHWILLIMGDNGAYPAQPFAWQRDIYLTVGPQVTSTYTPTLTVTSISIPRTTVTQTTTSLLVVDTGSFATVTIPSATAKNTKTITPKAVTTTSTKTLTKTKFTHTRVITTTTQTKTATCMLPGRPSKVDKPAQHSPTRLHPAALATPTTIHKGKGKGRRHRRPGRMVNYEWARARIEAAKQKRNAKNQGLERRAPDVETTTITAETPVTTTTTSTAFVTTTTETELITQTSTSILAPTTAFYGVFTRTTTLPTPTKTNTRIDWATTTKTISWGATYTKYSTVTPQASATACRRAGGHFRH